MRFLYAGPHPTQHRPWGPTWPDGIPSDPIKRLLPAVCLLQVLAAQAPLDLPTARIAEPQAEHLLVRILQKRPKDRLPIEAILRHAFLAGGLDTQQVSGSFAMLNDSQQAFKDELAKLQEGVSGGGGGGPSGAAVSFGAADSFKPRDSFSNAPRGNVSFGGAKGGGGGSVLQRAGMK